MIWKILQHLFFAALAILPIAIEGKHGGPEIWILPILSVVLWASLMIWGDLAKPTN
jgi:hypothetical protein